MIAIEPAGIALPDLSKGVIKPVIPMMLIGQVRIVRLRHPDHGWIIGNRLFYLSEGQDRFVYINVL